MTTLCFLDAFHAHKGGQISWDEYLTHLLIHLTGVEHKEDDRDGLYPALRYTDPFGYEIWGWSRDLERKVTNIGPLEAVFQAYRKGSVDETRDRLAALEEGHVKTMRKSVAFLALHDRKAKALEMCFKQGSFPYEAYFIDEADRVEETKDPETFRVLEQSTLRKHYPRLPPGPGRDGPPWVVFDRGGKLPVDW